MRLHHAIKGGFLWMARVVLRRRKSARLYLGGLHQGASASALCLLREKSAEWAIARSVPPKNLHARRVSTDLVARRRKPSGVLQGEPRPSECDVASLWRGGEDGRLFKCKEEARSPDFAKFFHLWRCFRGHTPRHQCRYCSPGSTWLPAHHKRARWPQAVWPPATTHRAPCRAASNPQTMCR